MSTSSTSSSRRRPILRIALPAAIVFAAFLAGFAFAATSSKATAGHWHDYCNAGGSTWHGLVHGGSTSDNAWHARVTTDCGTTDKYCEGGSAGLGSKGAELAYGSATCNKLVYGSAFYYRDQECWGWAYVAQAYRIDPHYHYSHYYGCSVARGAGAEEPTP